MKWLDKLKEWMGYRGNVAVVFFRYNSRPAITLEFDEVIVSKKGIHVKRTDGYELLYSWDKISMVKVHIADIFFKRRHNYDNVNIAKEWLK